MLKIPVASVVLFALSVVAIAQNVGPATAPAHDGSRKARQVVLLWMNNLLEKNADEVALSLGANPAKEEWEFNGKKELKMQHKLDEHSSLTIYFLHEKVLKVSVHILSD